MKPKKPTAAEKAARRYTKDYYLAKAFLAGHAHATRRAVRAAKETLFNNPSGQAQKDHNFGVLNAIAAIKKASRS